MLVAEADQAKMMEMQAIGLNGYLLYGFARLCKECPTQLRLVFFRLTFGYVSRYY
jgi:hypothetical protein